MNITRITLQLAASGRLLLRPALPISELIYPNYVLRHCVTLYSSELYHCRWPIQHWALHAAVHWVQCAVALRPEVQTVPRFPPLLETQFGKYLAGSWGLRKKRRTWKSENILWWWCVKVFYIYGWLANPKTTERVRHLIQSLFFWIATCCFYMCNHSSTGSLLFLVRSRRRRGNWMKRRRIRLYKEETGWVRALNLSTCH